MADPTATLERLKNLGFVCATDPNLGPAEVRLELVLREFQRYATEAKVAREELSAPVYADRLKSVPNTARYTGKAHGHLDAETEAVLQEWEKNTNQWRCPVVIETWWTAPSTIPDPDDPKKKLKWHKRDRLFNSTDAQNVWLWDHGKRMIGKLKKGTTDFAANQRARFYAVDLSGRFGGLAAFDTLVKEDQGRILIGQHDVKTEDGIDGPVASIKGRDLRHRVTPERITGDAYSKLTQGQKIVYRIARAVSSAECEGFLDSFTAADRAILSFGLIHWTLSHFDGKDVERGELEAFCAYLKKEKTALFQDVVGRFGLEPVHPWFEKGGNTGLVVSALRKFDTNFLEYAWDDANQKLIQREVPRDIDRYNMFRSWHWIYRFHILLRVSKDLPLAMWDMIRFRIRDILQVPVPTSLKIPENVSGTPLVLGDIFRSEELIALLVEWHVQSPSTLLKSGEPTDVLVQAISSADRKKVPLDKAPKEWKAEAETELKDAIFSTLKKRKLRGLRDRLHSRLATATGTDFSSALAPHTNQKRLSIVRFTPDVILFDDANLYPPPKWAK